MNYYKAILQYDGTHHLGFQWQVGMPTIQRELNQSLEKVLEGKVTTRAASRTDKGVHAFGQVVKISAENPRQLDITQLNAALPTHMRCLALSPCKGDFIPSVDQVSKEYRYLFTNTSHFSGIDQRFIAQTPYSSISIIFRLVLISSKEKITFETFGPLAENQTPPFEISMRVISLSLIQRNSLEARSLELERYQLAGSFA